MSKLPITVILAAKDEEKNIARCLQSLTRAERVVVVDSHSRDATGEIAAGFGVEIAQFHYAGGYPKKRQWALENLDIQTEWVLLIDADEVVPDRLWDEIESATKSTSSAFLITKGFHFLGRRFRFGAFSFASVLLFRSGCARFEELFDDDPTGLDMEVHERVIVDGDIGKLKTPLIHEDFNGLEAYIDRHNKYSTWEAKLRLKFLTSGRYGKDSIRPRFWGNTQERRRFLKYCVLRLPFEPLIWFCYHYFLRLGFLEGRAGLIACEFRRQYIAQVRAKISELRFCR